MPVQKSSTVSLKISAQPQYISDESRPEQNYFFFSYRISIQNKGHETIQLMSRHWIITDGIGNVEEVRGPGVVGLQPKIQPGQNFEYESACPLTTSTGSMRGFYTMLTESGESVQIEIPEFYLVSPQSLH